MRNVSLAAAVRAAAASIALTMIVAPMAQAAESRAAAVAPVSADTRDVIAASILELEKEIGAAISRGDAAVADRIWSDAYQYLGSDGKLYDKAQRLALTKPAAPGANAPVGSVDDVRIRVIDDSVAVALVWTTWRSTVDGQERVLRFVASHVWVREAAGWRLNTAQVGAAAKG